MKNLADAKYLHENMDRVVIIDATNNFMIASEGREKYDKRHIRGAFHIDLKMDMCRPVTKHGGRDPLPEDMNSFREKLEEFGISTDSEVIVYDENMVPASRFWWMCRYIGLKNVKLLDGGINSWTENGYELTDEPSQLPQRGSIDMKLDPDCIADIDDIRRAIWDDSVLIIDSRSSARYSGREELIDVKAGHIPGAKNSFYENVLRSDGKYRSTDEIRKVFEGFDKYREVIVHCGSGVSGPVNIIALDEIGIDSKLYVGSWSDYITYEDSIIATGDI